VAPIPKVTGIYDEPTGSIQYVVADPQTRRCAIIDPVLDFDPISGRVGTASADALLALVAREGLTVDWLLDTHPHADHFSAADYLRSRTGAPKAIGEHVADVQRLWADIYNWPDFPCDGSQWDQLFAHGDSFSIGDLPVEVMFSPGHTLASVSYLAGDAVFVHDTMFMPDSGTARADFPGGDAARLWQSINDLLALPEDTRVFVGHDYRPGGREARWETTVGEERARNIHIAACRDVRDFVALRTARDRTLPLPRLMLAALQVNINGGRLPAAA
jgi:glyoxylase-like metal-dependent hydrolase (beta-lactamase superfamily II)